MKKYLPIIAVFSLIKLTIHLVGNRNYGFHRDELLHLSVSEHLNWGYFEFPPFIALTGRLAHFLFGYSLSGVRLFATAAGIAIVILCCMIAKEMGGKSKAIILSGVGVLAFLPFYRNHMLFQPVAFDQLFWTLGFYLIVKYINIQHSKYLLALGITAGIGTMNKYTFLVWGVGVTVGLLFYHNGKLFKQKWIYIAGLIAFLICLPNIIWQYSHNFPMLLHMQKLKESQLDDIEPFDFALAQLDFPFTFILAGIGLLALFADAKLKKYKPLGIATVVIFAVMWIMQSKAYYIFAIYPLLFAAGAVRLERLLERKPIWNYLIVGILLLPVVFYLPKAMPILPITTHIEYEGLTPNKEGRIILTDDYADMFGWEEQVASVDSVYKALPQYDKNRCVIWAENYGEAGALKILGKKYNLPEPICIHGSFWLWGAGSSSREVCISIGNEKEVLEHFYSNLELVKIIKHRYAIDEENNIPLYICREPKIDLAKKWPDLKKYIFD